MAQVRAAHIFKNEEIKILIEMVNSLHADFWKIV